MKVMVHCTGCGETWESHPKLVGALCGKGRVRLATEDETSYVRDFSDPNCDGRNMSCDCRECAEYDVDPTAGFIYPTDKYSDY